MTHPEIEEYLLKKPNSWLEHPYGEGIAVYKVGSKDNDTEAKMFALITEGSDPIQMSLKCDPHLTKMLREEYDTVMPARNLHKKYWNTILTGQISEEYLYSLMDLSYRLASEELMQ